jgi:hypothetical protein
MMKLLNKFSVKVPLPHGRDVGVSRNSVSVDAS